MPWRRRTLQWAGAAIAAASVIAISACEATTNAATVPPGDPAVTTRSYGINVEPSYRPWRWAAGPNPDSWWDPVNGRRRVDAEMAKISELRVTYLRIEFPWTFIEPRQNQFDWTRADYIVAAARRYHVQLQPVIVYCPPWVGVPSCVPQPTQFGSFVAALVGRYHRSVHYWEMWNESDDSKYFSGTEQQYVKNVLNPGYRAAKKADPTSHVILSGQYNTSQSWIDGLFTYGAKFDIAAYHDYSGSAATANAMADDIRGWLRAHGFGGQLWLGEFGLQEQGIHDTNQQAYFTGVIASRNPSSVIMWYSLRDDRIYSGRDRVDHSEYYGLLTYNLTRKDGFCVYRRLVSQSRC